jgi:broad specificity phosphatase PhoE
VSAAREVEVTQLLQDWLNFLPPADTGNFLTEEMMWRWDKGSLVGESYDLLERALKRLEREDPEAHSAISRAYLDDEMGHSEVDFWRRNALLQPEERSSGATDWRLLVIAHNRGIRLLGSYLHNFELYVRWPSKAAVDRRRGLKMEERHDELVEVYKRYKDEGLKHSQALKNAAFKCEYTVQHARVIIKERDRVN